MRNIEVGKTEKRETSMLYRGRPITVELHPKYLVLGLKGKRDEVMIDYAAVLERAYMMRMKEATRA